MHFSALLVAHLLPTPAPQPAPALPAVEPLSAVAPRLLQTEPPSPDWYVALGFQTVTTRNVDGPNEEIDFDEGFAIPLALGHRFHASEDGRFGVSVELEGIYTDQEAEDDNFFSAVRDITGVSVLVNGVLDYAITEVVGVYGGLGVGLSWLDINTEDDGLSTFEDEDGPFLAWQAKAGVLFRVSESFGIDLAYRFLNIDDAEIDDTNGNASFDLETQQHMIGLGLRFGV